MTLETTFAQALAATYICAGLLIGFKSLKPVINYHKRQKAGWDPERDLWHR